MQVPSPQFAPSRTHSFFHSFSSPQMRLLSKILLGITVGYTGIIATAAFYQNELIYMKRSYDSYGLLPYYESSRAEFEKLAPNQRRVLDLPYTITVKKNSTKHANEWNQTAFWIPPSSSSTKDVRLWIMLGGNAQVALDWLSVALKVVKDHESSKKEEAILLIDFPGYGKSDGVPNMESIVASVTEATKMALLTIPEERKVSVGILGHSLGSAAALAFASFHASGSKTSKPELYPDRLVLGSPFVSIPQMAMHMFLPGVVDMAPPSLVDETLVKSENRWSNFDALQVLSKGNKPKPFITIFHGDRDEIVPYKQGKAVAALAKSLIPDAKFVSIKGGDHNMLIEESWNVVRAAMLDDRPEAKL